MESTWFMLNELWGAKLASAQERSAPSCPRPWDGEKADSERPKRQTQSLATSKISNQRHTDHPCPRAALALWVAQSEVGAKARLWFMLHTNHDEAWTRA